MEEQKNEYKVPITNERTEDFVRALKSGDRKIIRVAYATLTPTEKIKYKMILTKARKEWVKNKKAKLETKDVS